MDEQEENTTPKNLRLSLTDRRIAVDDFETVLVLVNESDTIVKEIAVIKDNDYADLLCAAEDLCNALQLMKRVTRVLGAGIGHVAADAEFFALWNEAEISTSKALLKARSKL